MLKFGSDKDVSYKLYTSLVQGREARTEACYLFVLLWMSRNIIAIFCLKWDIDSMIGFIV